MGNRDLTGDIPMRPYLIDPFLPLLVARGDVIGQAGMGIDHGICRFGFLDDVIGRVSRHCITVRNVHKEDGGFRSPLLDEFHNSLEAHVPCAVKSRLMEKMGLDNQDIRFHEKLLLVYDIDKIRRIDKPPWPLSCVLLEDVSDAPLSGIAVDGLNGDDPGFELLHGFAVGDNSPFHEFSHQVAKASLHDMPGLLTTKGGDRAPSFSASVSPKGLQFVQTDVVVTVTMGDKNRIDVLNPVSHELKPDVRATVDQKVFLRPDEQGSPKPLFSQSGHVLTDPTFTPMFRQRPGATRPEEGDLHLPLP